MFSSNTEHLSDPCKKTQILPCCAITVGPLENENLHRVSKIYFARCNYLRFKSALAVEEYLRRHIKSRSYLHGYVIKENVRIVGASCMVKAKKNVGNLLFTFTDDGFTGPDRMVAFGKAYRNTVKALVQKGIHVIQSSATKENRSAIDYSLATGYIKFADTGTRVYFETYLPLIASTISTCSTISLDNISLLKLANIGSNPTGSDDSSYTFDYVFKNRHYEHKVDKLGAEMESVAYPEFSSGFRYSKPVGFAGEKLKVSFEISNPTGCAKECRCVIKVRERGMDRIVLREKKLLGTGFSTKFPLDCEFSAEGIKTFTAEVFTDQKQITLSKAFVVRKPYRVTLNIAEASAGQMVLDIQNVAGKRLELGVVTTSAKLNPFDKKLSLAKGATKSVRLTDPNGRPQEGTSNRLELKTRGGKDAGTVTVSKKDGIVRFADGEMFVCVNERVVVGMEKATGIVSFREATDPKCMLFQLPEELGPPFTEYEFNRFQSLPTSYRMPGFFPGSIPFPLSNNGLKPRIRMSDTGLKVSYRLDGRKGLLLEKKIIFKERDAVEIQPKIVNGSGEDIRSKIAFRTCLKIMADTIIRVPIYRGSSVAKSRLSENPYYVDELLLKGSRLTENWTAFEFPESNKCVGLVWEGNPEYDFFPLWFNKMPWLMYSVNLKSGEEMVLPPFVIAFKNGSWEAIREIWNKNKTEPPRQGTK